ncbi:MAG: 2-oxo acid dehydrogenase subunit E2 [Armatimonadetes bacterium]|nr:2-oxo acid dehydrogenase subunit E2 [Armatimonadota bacterium]MDE2206178.1 2-oxo acid dehydrogenase subunit E2 [Armatimonadota bacterium]
MTTPVIMPMVGTEMEEGTVVAWRKAVGDRVRAGEVLLEIMTDKATMEVEAEADGVLLEILAPVDTTMPVRATLAIIGEAGEVTAADTSASTGSRPTAASSTRLSPRARRAAEAAGVPPELLAGRGTGPNGRIVEQDVAALVAERGAEPTERAVRATPLAARMAADLQLDLSRLELGLPGSRIRSDEVRAAAASSPSADGPLETVIRLSAMRKSIADHVAGSAFSAPHVTLATEVDMTEAVALRKQLLPVVELRYGSKLSYNDLVVKACAVALVEHPWLNSTLSRSEITLHAHRNIGVAVALDPSAEPGMEAMSQGGLVTAVIRDADIKSVGAVSAELKTIVDRCRSGRIRPEDTSGGTFTISNLGSFGVEFFNPIITPGQCAILGIGRMAERAVVRGGAVVVRTTMYLALSFDHRIVDGAPAARCLQRIRELLEAPAAILA